MKTKLLMLLVMLILLGGCQFFKMFSEITINTDLVTDINVIATGEKSDVLTEGILAASFAASAPLSLSDNPDLEEYVDKIKEIELTDLKITVYGLPSGYTINTLSVDVAGVGTLCTQSNITSSNASFTPAVDSDKLTMAAAILESEKEIYCTVFGTVSGPLSWVVTIDFGAKVVANPLD